MANTTPSTDLRDRQVVHGIAWTINNIATVLTIIGVICAASIAYAQIGQLRAQVDDQEVRLRKVELMDAKLDAIQAQLNRLLQRP